MRHEALLDGKPILISHRGNLLGPNPALENTWSYVAAALAKGFHVEIDVRSHNHQLWLGHDQPGEPVTLDQLRLEMLWCHAKDPEALDVLLKARVHCFWHDCDAYTLTSRGHLWTHPNSTVCSNSIVVTPELAHSGTGAPMALPRSMAFALLQSASGLCSDWIGKYRTMSRSTY